MSKEQAASIHPEQDEAPAGTRKHNLRFKVTKVETPIPPGGFIYAGCICAGGLTFPKRYGAEVP